MPCTAPAMPGSHPVINANVLLSYVFRIYKSKGELIFFFFFPPQSCYNATVLDVVKTKERINSFFEAQSNNV